MKIKFGLLVVFAAASLWAGNSMYAQSGSAGSSGSSTQSSQRGDEASTTNKSQGSSRQSDQYGSSSSSSSQTQKGGTPSSGARTGQTGRPSGMGTPASQEPKGTTATETKGTRRGGHDASAEIQNHPALSSKLGTMLPAGTSVEDAASGFKNLGEFVAAVHLSQNLNIPFDQLKTKVTGGQSLGDAVKDLKPGVDVKTEVKKARDEAKDDMKASK